jgi:hypothetical protein
LDDECYLVGNWNDLLVMKVLALFKAEIGNCGQLVDVLKRQKREFRILFIFEDF